MLKKRNSFLCNATKAFYDKKLQSVSSLYIMPLNVTSLILKTFKYTITLTAQIDRRINFSVVSIHKKGKDSVYNA
jgi:hypothetical protein